MSGALTLAGVDLLTGVGGTYKLRALGSLAGTSLVAAPVPIVAALESFLQDGAAVATTGHGNRTLPLVVRVTANDEEGLAAGEAALVGACAATWGAGAVAELAWTRPTGAACVFEVVAAALEATQWHDMAEVPDPNGSQLVATYLLTLTCLPWVKSDTPITISIPAPTNTSPVYPTITEVDDCSSTTGWATQSGATLGTGGGGGDAYVYATLPTSTTPTSLYLKRTGLSVAMGTANYVMITAVWRSSIGPNLPGGLNFKLNGTAVTPAARSGSVYYLPFTGTLNSVEIDGSWAAGGMPAGKSVTCYDISTTDMITAGSVTQKQLSRFFAVQGSVRAPASIGLNGTNVSTGGTADLGDVIVYTSKANNGALALKQYAGSGGSTDTTAYSNNKWDLSSGGMTCLTKYAQLNQAGYLVLARVQASASGPATITLKTRSTVTLLTTTVNIAAANTWQLVTLGTVALPETVWEDPNQSVDFEITSATLKVDECWLFDIDNGQVTVVGATGNVGMWLDAPSGQVPSPAIYLSSQWVRGSGRQAMSEIVSWGPHQFPAGGVNVFVAAANPVKVDLTYTPRWHTRARALT